MEPEEGLSCPNVGTSNGSLRTIGNRFAPCSRILRRSPMRGRHSETYFLYAKNRTRRFSDRFLRHTPLFCTQKSSKYLHCSIQLVRGGLFSVKHAPTG